MSQDHRMDAVIVSNREHQSGFSGVGTYLCIAFALLFLCLLSTAITHRAPTTHNRDDAFDQLVPQIKSMAFVGQDDLWLVGNMTGELWRTLDGGKTWKQTTGAAVGGRFYCVSFVNRQRGWAVGTAGIVWRSDDGGRTWSKISTLAVANPRDWVFVSSEQIQFFEDRTGWVVETFGIWHSEDDGISWKRVLSIGDPGITGQPAKAAFLSSKLAVVSSADGQVYRSEDGGTTWQVRPVIKNGDFRDVSFPNETIGWLSGYGPPNYDESLYRSEDGGRSWRLQPPTNRNISINSIHFLNEEEGWAAGSLRPTGERDSLPMRALVLHTVDGGKSWEQRQVDENQRAFYRIGFFDALHGWLFARDTVYRTEDGGKTWHAVLNLH